ncbi:MAG: phosphoenolpyruvate kinase [Oligoflexia bacterium]|nr:phosphoenolpyruvate kinase [Oligoflexia bacterium]
MTSEETLKRALADFNRAYPAQEQALLRQPVHTVYGGAHLFKAGSLAKLGALALKAFDDNAPDPGALGRTLGYEADAALARTVHERVRAKLAREAIEDYRIDFEDGYGYRTDDEEDTHARAAAVELATAMSSGALPHFCGIRIKAFSEENHARAARTLELFLTALSEAASGRLPENFRVTLPKVVIPEQVSALGEQLSQLEKRLSFPAGAIRIELMIETPQALLDRHGRCTIPALVAAARGRCASVHLGPYDYTSALGISSSRQDLLHPLCDLARGLMQLSLAGTGVLVSDGASHLIPVGSGEVVRKAWAHSYRQMRHALENGIYQGWDLHPAQIPARYAAFYVFFLENLPQATARLKSFLEKAAQASLSGQHFDDRSSAQGLLNFFLRGLHCGALTESELLEAGLSADLLRTGSFA